MANIIGGVCLLITGIIILVINIKELKEKGGMAGSIFSAIIDAFFGTFQFSTIGGIIIGLAFIIIGVVMLF